MVAEKWFFYRGQETWNKVYHFFAFNCLNNVPTKNTNYVSPIMYQKRNYHLSFLFSSSLVPLPEIHLQLFSNMLEDGTNTTFQCVPLRRTQTTLGNSGLDLSCMQGDLSAARGWLWLSTASLACYITLIKCHWVHGLSLWLSFVFSSHVHTGKAFSICSKFTFSLSLFSFSSFLLCHLL